MVDRSCTDRAKLDSTPLKLQHHGANGPYGALTLVMYLEHHSENTKEIIAYFEPNKL